MEALQRQLIGYGARGNQTAHEVHLRLVSIPSMQASGCGRSEIAQELGMHRTTVSVRMCEINQRLGTAGIPDSIHEARRLGLLEA